MHLRDLEYFAAIARHRNLSRASEELDLTPAAVSKSLRRLEESVGVQLVERTAKGVEVTSAGAALLAQVNRVRLTLEDTAREAADLGRGHAGVVRIGLSGDELAPELAAAYAAVRRDSTNVTLEVTVSSNDVMIPQLRAGELDMVIDFVPPGGVEGTISEPLFESRFVVCASARHRLAARKSLALSELASERWALAPPDIFSRRLLLDTFRNAALPPPRVAVEARAFRVRVHIWAHTDLLGMTSSRALRQAAKAFGLVELRIKGVSWPRPVGVMYRKDGYRSPAARRLIERLRVELGKKP
jgi:DNA-binding transcriptional LysR family regulator